MPENRSTRWCFTINNWTPEDVTRLCDLDTRYLVFGREVGENGTRHLQGYVEFPSRKRFAAAKEAISARAHLELARGTAEENATYCKKDNDFEEFGEPAVVRQGKRSDWDRLREWLESLESRPSQRELINQFPGLYARYAGKLDDIVSAMLPEPQFTVSVPREGWQRELHQSVEQPAHDREIDFWVDEEGNSGKTWMARYLLQTMPAKVQYLRPGKRDDMAYAVDESKSVFIIDVPRTQMEFLQYSVLEMVKDRLVFSPKYNSTTKIIGDTPHVIVFSNEKPDYMKLSSDRFNVRYTY